MQYKFWKYQGTGNDFIFFDGRMDTSVIKDNQALIEQLCNRRFGIGADGLIILEKGNDVDFNMVYYNSDGRRSTMCGNGGRCSVAFAHKIGLAQSASTFEAVDGLHDGRILDNSWISLGMIDVPKIMKIKEREFEINTGSPHFVKILKEGEKLDIKSYGREVRYSEKYAKVGINVNLVNILDDGIEVQTYERGVEDETYSCGTGVTAAAIAYFEWCQSAIDPSINVFTKGGPLRVEFKKVESVFTDVLLSGPATLVFEGYIEL